MTEKPTVGQPPELVVGPSLLEWIDKLEQRIAALEEREKQTESPLRDWKAIRPEITGRDISAALGIPQQEPPPEEPDYTCPVPGCGKPWDQCDHAAMKILAAANARIRALEKERDEARRERDAAERFLPEARKTGEALGRREGRVEALEELARKFEQANVIGLRDREVAALIRAHVFMCVGIQLTTPWPHDGRAFMAATGDVVLLAAAAALLFSKDPEKGGTP